METPIEKLQRAIFSVDTEAGYRFRYHVTRATANVSYRERLSLNRILSNFPASRLLERCFIWHYAQEGHDYWRGIQGLLLRQE